MVAVFLTAFAPLAAALYLARRDDQAKQRPAGNSRRVLHNTHP